MAISPWIPTAIGAGATLLGGALQGRSANQASERQWELLQQEMARRNQLQGMIAPQLLHAAGIRNPAQVANYSRIIGQPSGGQLQQGVSTGGAPTAGSGATSKVLGGVGTGLGIASMLPATSIAATNSGVGSLAAQGLGALGIPSAAIPFIGPAILGGSIAASQIGKGRRTANTMTNPKTGAEGQLVEALRNPQTDVETFKRAYDAYQQSLAAYRQKGGNYAKVAEQSLANQPLQQTIAQRMRELGLG